jgi:hypothetical protein
MLRLELILFFFFCFYYIQHTKQHMISFDHKEGVMGSYQELLDLNSEDLIKARNFISDFLPEISDEFCKFECINNSM